MQKEKIVVVGFGWVGQANALALLIDDYDVSYFDIGEPNQHYKKEYPELYPRLKKLKSILEIDSEETSYIICVGDRVDENGNQDIENIKKALISLKTAKGVVVLRSTILPSYLKDLDFDIYLPEFLHEKAAVKECVNPQYIVVGKKTPETKIPAFIETWRKRSFKQMDSTPEDAAHVKYLSNLWNALKIAFTNEYGSSITLPQDLQSTERIDNVLNFVFDNQPYLHYGRGFGGHCLPKDSRAYSNWASENGKDVSLIKGMIATNDNHIKTQEKFPHLKEWYSNWPEQVGSGWVALDILKESVKRNFLHPFQALARKKTVIKRKNIK